MPRPYHHELVSRLTPEAFRADLRRAKELLEDLAGQPSSDTGRRASRFKRRQAWAHDTLLQEGFRYDSSLYPIFHDLFGDPTAPRHSFRDSTCGRATHRVPHRNGQTFLASISPIGGGGYFASNPWPSRGGRFAGQQSEAETDCLLFSHPWELDSDQPLPAHGGASPFSPPRRFSPDGTQSSLPCSRGGIRTDPRDIPPQVVRSY